MWRCVPTHAFWDYAFARWFGRAKGIASMLFQFIFFMVAFYPSLAVFVGSFSLLVAISLGLGWWQRRLLRAQLGAGQADAAALTGQRREHRALLSGQ